MSHARSKTACWGCGAEPSEGVKFQVCSRCSEAQLGTRAVYCSTECQRRHWSLHKRWHAAQELTLDARRAAIEHPCGGVAAREQELDARIAARAEAPSADAPTYKLLAQAHACMQDSNFKRAVKYHDKAIKLSRRILTPTTTSVGHTSCPTISCELLRATSGPPSFHSLETNAELSPSRAPTTFSCTRAASATACPSLPGSRIQRSGCDWPSRPTGRPPTLATCARC